MSPISYYTCILPQTQYLVYLEFVHNHPLVRLHLADYALESAYIATGKGRIYEPFALGPVVMESAREFWMWAELAQITHCANLGRL
jgi:hypothetical protein